ncbi:uncharacterized protein LOC111032708 [Myzus persicae]|uniref:uncharacterized protein LOC111032708 n=1 Tax=Myzus persicae TaxID=13164 RepID=UPI000B93926C|nr:uncharacterized protein LOC111032708 [Myzus persicae]
MGTSNLAAYLVLLLITSATADVSEDYDYPYTDFFPELSIQPSGLDATADADSDEMQDLRFVDYKSVPKLATVLDDLPLSSTQLLSAIVQRSNTSVADGRLKQTTVAKKSGGVPWHDSDFGSIYLLYHIINC